MASDLPKTVLYPNAFRREASAGFDGVFDWSFLLGAFPRKSISPMDIDCSVEINSWFLDFEKKALGKAVPLGQLRAHKSSSTLLHPRVKKPARRIILLWGSDGIYEWNHIVNGAMWPRRKRCNLDDVRRLAFAWGICAERNDMSEMPEIYRILKVREPTRSLDREPDRQGDLFQPIGEVATKVLASLRAKP